MTELAEGPGAVEPSEPVRCFPKLRGQGLWVPGLAACAGVSGEKFIQ